MPGLRGVEVVAVALLLDSLLGSDSLLVHPGEGSVHSAAFPVPATAGFRMWEALVTLRQAICKLGRVSVRLRLSDV